MPAPHQPPAAVRAALRERLFEFVQKHPAVVESKESADPERPFPGRPLAEPSTDSKAAWVEQKLQETERMLFQGAGGCRYCHPLVRTPRLGELPEYEPSRLARRWMPHSRFDHQAHRMLQCAECHAAAQSSKTSDVLMPRIADCRQCHNPKVGGRTECYECHLYHDHEKSVEWQGKLRIGDTLGRPTR
jgi:hypothetical protein